MTGYGIAMPVFAKRIGELGSGVQALGLITDELRLRTILALTFHGIVC